MKVSRNSECFCGSEKKTKKCHPDIHPESKAAITLKTYQKIENEVTVYRETHKVNSPCKMGCAECCSDKFYISNVEFEIILKELRDNWNDNAIEAIYDKAFNNLELLKSIDNNLYHILEGDGNKDTSLYYKQVFSGSKRLFPCLFLDEETQSCKIYNSRPLVCRTHGTTHDNAKITPDVGQIMFEADRNFHIQIDKKYFRIREYPIFYWFIVYYNKNGKQKKATLLEEDYYFKLPKEIGDIQQLKRYSFRRL
jgi:Fe-S-cluster containining protein